MDSVPELGVTGLLQAWSANDTAALERLIVLVYPELRKIARRCLSGENPGTLYKLPRWSMKPIFGWSTFPTSNGRIELISSRSAPASCAASW